MVPQEVQAVLRRLEAAGFEAYLVGGCVRDMLRGIVPHDWDITTSALPEETMALFAHFAIPTGLQHGTVTVRAETLFCEVTTFRTDGDYADHRRPDTVRFTRSLREDLARRDFTVNAMAMDSAGSLHDPFGGQSDLKGGILRCVGAADQRFSEDALRILRALRFAATLGFTVEAETAAALRRRQDDLHFVAAERIREELQKLLLGSHAAAVLLSFPQVIGVVIPELLPCVGFAQHNRHHRYDVWEHTVRAVAAAPQDAVVRWALLLHDLGKPATFTRGEDGVGHFYGHAARSAELAEAVCRRLRFDNRSRERIVKLVAWHDRDVALTEKAIARLLRQLGVEDARALCAVKRGDNLAQHEDYHSRQKTLDEAEAMIESLLAREVCFSVRQLAVNGSDLMNLGLRGQAVGQMLETLLQAVMDGAVENEKAALLALARSKA